MSETFALDVSKWVEKAKDNCDQIVRKVPLEILTQLVDKSPVGDPDLWKANAGAVAHNSSVQDANAALRTRAENLDKRGRLRRGLKLQKRSLPAGRGYVGGRFKNNWFTSVGAPSGESTQAPDATGAGSMGRGRAVLGQVTAGQTIFIVNNLPYAIKIEYGHSTQAPNGLVRLTATEYARIVAEAVAALP